MILKKLKMDILFKQITLFLFQELPFKLFFQEYQNCKVLSLISNSLGSELRQYKLIKTFTFKLKEYLLNLHYLLTLNQIN